ncbi:MAG TPA: ABC transporter ATP-binding protein, partial [Clostridiales bacterium]|nr:ABC transporter ATP-binding protein [Clostridiales bacterium]
MRSREAVEERAIYGFTENLNNRYIKEYEKARNFRLKIAFRIFIKQKTGSLVATLYSVIAMIALIPPVMNEDISIAMFIAIMGAMFGLSNRLSYGVTHIIADITKNREYLKDLTEFMALDYNDDAIAEPEKAMLFNKIEYRNVSFKYPDTEKLILDDISFIIESGKHYSFVGANGAGKTTITKLITGLYSNYTGEILVDGRSLSDFSQAELKGLSSVVYQDFAKYNISLYDNIALSNIENYDDHKAIENAAELVGLTDVVSRLKKGFSTPLGKILEDGTDLSGGEWQKTAMARSIMSNAPLKILDEPTASLDPISESKVYNNFEQVSRGMTTFFI